MSLDPDDWEAFRATMHRAVDAVVDDLAAAGEGPAWRAVPDGVKDALLEPPPARGEPLETTLARFDRLVRPYPTGNRHPRFFGWVHGAGNAAGVLAELLAAGMNANVGGREHAAVYVERAVIAWFRALFAFPETAGGVVTTGTSMGNLLGVVAARDAALGAGARARGVAGARLTAYASDAAHDSVAKAMRVAGLGEAALRRIGTGAAGTVDAQAMRARIEADRHDGARPFLIVATAGSVDTGAFDPLHALADLAAQQHLWLHVDGAFGALAIASPRHAHLTSGIARADSLAFDAHKWLHVPYAAGVLLVRDECALHAAFASSPAYLARAERGAAAGAPWFADAGIELSREFRALKLWFTLRHYGIERLGASIARTCDLARHLAAAVSAHDDLELLAPVTLNVVCFRAVRPGLDAAQLDALNERVAVAVQESGAAVPSSTRVGGKRALRACIVNHRTGERDVEALVDAVRTAAAGVPAEAGS